MARINNLKVTNSYRLTRSGVTQCSAELNIYTHEGERMVRLQTFGSTSRQDKGKQSQVLHIDKDIAQKLIKALQEAFDIK